MTSGFETCYLIVHEVDESGRIVYEGRFDEDDFEGAYRELSDATARRGRGVRRSGATSRPKWLIALNQGDFDRVFGELTDPDMRA